MIGFMPRAIVTDIDGTLTGKDLLINLDAVRMIRELEGRGVTVILASGNALPVAFGLARYIGTTGPIIAEDGGVVYYKGNTEVLGDRRRALDFLEELKREYGDAVEESFTNKYREFDVAIYRSISIDMIEKILSRYPDLTIVDSKFAYHIHTKGIDKGVGLRYACDLIGVKPDEVVAIGDSELDIPLFTIVGYSISTANSSDRVKRYVNYVTSRGYGEGFVEAVRLILEALEGR